jgi:hypothetical protein
VLVTRRSKSFSPIREKPLHRSFVLLADSRPS